jgi:hypothetical protein
MAKCPKMRPRTKHLNIKYHHFRESVKNGEIEIKYIRSKLQLADIFTKALVTNLFVTLRLLIVGRWLLESTVQRECDKKRKRKTPI